MGGQEVPVLQNISLTIRRGEFVVIVGPSGSGKTTLLDILGCLSHSTSGRYCFDGIAVHEASDKTLSRIRNKKIGFVFQTFHLLGSQTALSNVALPLSYAGVSRKRRMEQAAEALGQVGLSDRMDHRPNQLSGGQQQRVAIARALVHSPDMILADEPTGNLDSVSGAEVIRLLIALHQNGHTLILVTHDTGIASLADRMITIKDGQVVGDILNGHC